jgi:2-dehydro-3-deoxyphosphogluconate aldolase/(4S)-4-hydroxy-2-oxoglutarate aldolase
MLVGAGTVLTVAQVDAAVAAGAEYIVTPGLNPKVL